MGVWEESAKCWWAPVDFQGEVMILGLSLLHVSDLNLIRKNACLQSSLLVPVVLEVLAHMDRREVKVPTPGKGWKLSGLCPGWRTEMKQDPVNNNFPYYSSSSPGQVTPLHQSKSWFSCSSPTAFLKFPACFASLLLLLSWMLVSSVAAWSCFPPSLGSLLLTGLMGLLPH